MKKPTLIISGADRARLETLIDSARMDSRIREDYLAALEGELNRARVVPAGKIPTDVVTMNSVVRLRDLDGRWIAVANFGDEPEVGIGATPREALAASLATLGTRTAAAVMADPQLFGLSAAIRQPA